jgi:hypothetical protein
MCQAKITDHYNNKYKCNLPDKYSITTIIIGKDKVKRIKTKILCSKHASILRKSLNYRIKHLDGNLTYNQLTITN